eukprot:TRINITY_DN48779_c0_g1_i1.p1 TRINITY_DN48779_c0_g1~~TRINITY_DN48779_c0_g1_i1.p1  ORF type:complete len:627 (-),score=103.01 TRINITY_DN48779_c0_g1_i1:187-2067(-)
MKKRVVIASASCATSLALLDMVRVRQLATSVQGGGQRPPFLLLFMLIGARMVDVEAIVVAGASGSIIRGSNIDPSSSIKLGRLDDFYTRSAADLTKRLQKREFNGPARRVLLFVSDGMGPNVHYAARLLFGQKAGLLGEEYWTELDSFPHVSSTRTHTVDFQTADSAGSGTAIHSGLKTKSGMLNCRPTLERWTCNATHHCSIGRRSAKADRKQSGQPPQTHAVQPLAQQLVARGVGTGVVTTARLTSPTPASLYATSADRSWEHQTNGCIYQKDIAMQLTEALQDGTLTVAFGGGLRGMVPAASGSAVTDSTTSHTIKGTTAVPEGVGGATAVAEAFSDIGQRQDGRDLLAELRAEGEHMRVIVGMDAWRDTNFSARQGDRYFASFPNADGDGGAGGSHLSFEVDRDNSTEPSLTQMTRAAIEAMEASHKRWFLTVEGGKVDLALHVGNLARALEDSKELMDAVAMARRMLPEEETTIIVTADHSHGLSFAGYCGRGSSPLGYCREGDPKATGWNEQSSVPGGIVRDSLGDSVTVSSFMTGPGSLLYKGPLTDDSLIRTDPSARQGEEVVASKDFVQKSLVPMKLGAHSGEDTMTYAWGTRSSIFSGTIDNTFIHHAIRHALDVS